MKELKFNHNLAEMVLRSEKTNTWRLFDDKDLAVNDQVVIIDKVDPHDVETWQKIGVAKIDSIVEKRLGDISQADMEGHEKFASKEAMLATYQDYYGPTVTGETPVKIIHFTFSKEIPFEAKEPTLPRLEKAIIYADGGSRGNPGPSASGYVIFNEHNKAIVDRGVYLGITTNNQAEYTALKLALEDAKRLGAKEVSVYMDSLLVVNQMKGLFKVRNRDLWPIHDAIRQLCTQFRKVNFTQVPRKLNKLADAAVNRALDEELNGNHATSGTSI